MALLASVVSVTAQDNKQEKSKPSDVIIERNSGVVVAGSGQEAQWSFVDRNGDGNTFLFVSGEMSFDGKVVKGAPYSAQAISESIQTLADGNRIVHKTTASVYRDGEGRTRRDQTLRSIGPYAVAGDPPQTTFINDPVAGVNYIFDSRSRTARKLPLPQMLGKGDDKVTVTAEVEASPRIRERKLREHEEMFIATAPPRMGPGPRPGAAFEFERSNLDGKDAKREALGKQTIEGVEAEGTRVTITIPAGEIGNELAIQIVTEQWYSPELQAVIMSKHTDPRMGEHTYRLTNITRGEPSRTLFEVPSDYTVRETIPPDVKIKIEREMRDSKRKPEDREF
jgi:hypothetical protein